MWLIHKDSLFNDFWGKHIRKEVGCSHPELAVWVNCRRDHSKGPRETIWFLAANSAVIVLQLPLHERIRKWSWQHLSLDHFFCSLPTFQDFGGRVINPLTKKRDIWLEQGLLSPHQCQLSTYLKQMYTTCTLQNSADFLFSFYSLTLLILTVNAVTACILGRKLFSLPIILINV